MTIFLELGLILILVKLLGELCERLRLPSIFGEISLGIILGPILGVIVLTPENAISSSAGIIKIFGEVGAIFLLFSIGFTKIDFEKISVSIKKVLPVTILGTIFPFAGGFLCSYIFSSTLFPSLPVKGSLLIGIALSATSIGVSVRSLIDLKYITTMVGVTVLFASVLDNFLSLIIIAIATGIIQTGKVSFFSLGVTLSLLTAFVLLSYLLGKFIFPLMAKLIDKMIVEEATMGIIIGTLFVFAYLTHRFGLHMIIGAFLFGTAISIIPIIKTEVIVHRVKGIAEGFFVPFFFLNIGLMFDVKVFENVGLFAIMLLLAVIGTQIIGGFLGGKIAGFAVKDAIIIGITLLPRNEIALVITTIGLNLGILNTNILSAFILIALITTFITPLLLKLILNFTKILQKFSISFGSTVV